jgi:N utilization substance protein A
VVSEPGRITVEELRFLSMFTDLTGATAYRCIIDRENDRLIFLVKPSDVGRAVGRRGKNLELLRKLFRRNVEVVPYSPDLEEMIRNLFPNARILDINVRERGDEKYVVVRVHEEDKGRAIGREGRNIKRARLVLRELFNVVSLQVR